MWLQGDLPHSITARMTGSFARAIAFVGLAALALLPLPTLARPASSPSVPEDHPEERARDNAERLWAELNAAREEGDGASIVRAAERALPIHEARIAELPAGSPARNRAAMRLGLIEAVLGRLESSRAAFAQVEGSRDRYEYLLLRLDAAAMFEDWDAMFDALEGLVAIEGAAPDSFVSTLTEDQIASVNMALIDDPRRRDRFAELLAASNWNRDAGPGARDWIFVSAMQSHFARGDEAGAIRLLDRVEGPQALVETLIQNRYAGLWPIIEARAGADLALFAAAYEDTLAREYRADPDNATLVELSVLHMSDMGRHAEALALAAPIADDPRRVAATDREGLWIVNHAAYAELALNRPDAALARMERLVARGLDSHPELISMAINRVLMLGSSGLYARALVEAEALAARTEAEPLASDYGEMFLWSAAACSAHALGQRDVAARWRARIDAMPDANEHATMRTYLCMDDMAAAEAFVIRRLTSDEPIEMLKSFQRSAIVASRTPADAELRARFEALHNRPAVRAALERVGRIRQFAISVS